MSNEDLTDRGPDWSDGFDDLDPEYWENLFAGYDYDQEEYSAYNSLEEAEWEEMCESSPPSDMGSYGDYTASSPEDNSTTPRRLEILHWLKQSTLIRKFKNNKGFAVANRNVRRKDGTVVSLTQWLTEEGFVHGSYIGEYNIKFEDSHAQYGERIFFLLKKNIMAFLFDLGHNL